VEAEAARREACSKEAQAEQLEREALLEVGKAKRLAELQGKWSCQLWWSSFNPNTGVGKDPVTSASSPEAAAKRPRLLLTVTARS